MFYTYNLHMLMQSCTFLSYNVSFQVVYIFLVVLVNMYLSLIRKQSRNFNSNCPKTVLKFSQDCPKIVPKAAVLDQALQEASKVESSVEHLAEECNALRGDL